MQSLYGFRSASVHVPCAPEPQSLKLPFPFPSWSFGEPELEEDELEEEDVPSGLVESSLLEQAMAMGMAPPVDLDALALRPRRDRAARSKRRSAAARFTSPSGRGTPRRSGAYRVEMFSALDQR